METLKELLKFLKWSDLAFVIAVFWVSYFVYQETGFVTTAAILFLQLSVLLDNITDRIKLKRDKLFLELFRLSF